MLEQVFVSSFWFLKEWIKTMELSMPGCRGFLLRVWLEHECGQARCVLERVCDVRRMRGGVRLPGEQASQMNLKKRF